jgi:Holliday junction resolvase RusA-like endonuclease
MTPHAVSFTVAGIAQPKGSAKAFGFRRGDGSVGAFVTSDNRNLKGWETNVRTAAQQQCQGVFFDGAVRVGLVFFLPRPQKPKSKHHITRPDLDKLVRGALDALKGVLWPDDSKVVGIVARKAYAITQPHARILVDYADVLEEVAIPQNLFSALEDTHAAHVE